MNTSELKINLVNLGVKESAYSINEEIGNEQYCIKNIGKKWFCFYSERGHRSNEMVFDNESEACDYFYMILKADPTVLMSS